MNNEDSIMEDLETPVGTSRATSMDSSAWQVSTRASTPTENRVEDPYPDTYTPVPCANDDAADNVTMKASSPRKIPSAATAQNSADIFKVVSWPSMPVIDPGSSPGNPGKTKETVDYSSEPQNVEELLHSDYENAPNLYTP